MTNPTSNFGWQMPTSTDLVTDLPADFETFGQAVDTSLADLKGGTSGQVLSKASNTDMDFTWVTSDDANAIQNAIVDAKGDLIAASANDTPARLAVGNNGEILVADSSTATGLRYTTLFGANKNKILNGDFYINQRNFTSNTANNTFNFDRWFSDQSGGTVTITPQTFTTGAAPVAGYEGKTFVQVAVSGQSGANYASITQRIEDVRTFAGQTITISFWAKAAAGTPQIYPIAFQRMGTGGSPSAGTATNGTPQNISTSWARYSWTITMPSLSGKTLGTNNDSNVELELMLSGASVAINNTTFQIWGVQVEAGSVATPFQTATGTIQGELAACQRYYYEESPLVGSQFNTTVIGKAAALHPVEMRTSPTVTVSNTTSFQSGNITLTATGSITNYSNTRFLSLDLTTNSAGAAGWAACKNAGTGKITVSAEL